MSEPVKNAPSPKKRSPIRREHAGWLMLFCVVSLVLHLGAGITSRRFDFGLPKTLPNSTPAEVEVSLAPPPAASEANAPAAKPAAAPRNKAPKARKSEQAAQTPRQTTPQATPPVSAQPQKAAQPPKTPTEKPREPAPETSTPSSVETAPGRAPEPLPLGVRTGQREVTQDAAPSPQPSVEKPPAPLTATPPPTRLTVNPIDIPRPQTTPSSEAMPPSVRVPSTAERPTLSAVPPPSPTLTAPVSKPTPDPAPRPVAPLVTATPPPNPTPTVATPSPVDAGPFGLTRGVPFGDRLGVPQGNPNGGGVNPYKPGFRFHMNPVKTDDTPPIHIVYVIDTSLSMADDKKIERAQKALEKALTELRTDDTFNIVPFSDRARLMFPSMRKVTNASMAQAESNIEFLTPVGDTNLSEALDLALDQKEVSHVFVMSDGTPTRGLVEFDEILEHVKERNTGNVRINALALGLGEKFDGMKLLRALAEQNGGKFDYINLRGR